MMRSAFMTAIEPACACGHHVNYHDFDAGELVPCWLCGCEDLRLEVTL